MTVHRICQLNIEALTELSELLKQIPDEFFTARLSEYCGPVGSQIRHIIEFYKGFLQGLDLGSINYDNRPRNSSLETSCDEALGQIDMICHHLALLDDQYEALDFQACGGADQTISTTSNMHRELLFLHNHTDHHKAIITLLLEPTGFKLPDNFGLALATRVYQQNKALPD
ncbi:DinB family protein [Endozoicomonas euniceicola]|uniref:DinB family protein n=1 Tax=Endozoicomonas euniceicola TaxID=1234143 RepID=A0ABY6GZ44_9GAMM|nr:DinB family protein [Endozoicomonas euniceicola]UYM17837.1 DinB family protein [Endozoicomonas euniceicola]